MQETKQNRNIVLRILTSKSLWILLISALVIFAVIKIAEAEIEKARSTYGGISDEGTVDYSFVSKEGFSRDEYNFISYEDDEYYTRRGIDVSAFQGEIDWNLVKESGVEFAMIRVGYRGYEQGQIHLDPYLESNIDGANAAGIDVGVYFFSQAITVEEAIEEAQFVCECIKGKKISMPVAFDMEPTTHTENDRIHNLTMREITEISDAFCTVIEKHGYEPIIYGNPTWIYNHLNLSIITGRNIWLANYTEFSHFPYEYLMWQYTDSGTIGGIEGGVDLDLQFVKKQ